jgi:hypothetical protein
MVAASSAVASKPVFVSISATPRVLPSSGGVFTVTARVRHAVTCTIYASGLGASRTVNCSSGRITYKRHAPANTSTGPDGWGVYIEAHSGNQNARSKDAEVEVPASVAAAPPIPGLDVCTAGPGCDYGPIGDSFQTWGNVAPATLGDCTFAAAANWEQIKLDLEDDPTVIGYEFAQAGGTAERGLAQSALWSYWKKSGIDGVDLTSLDRLTTDQEDVENGVRDYTAMIVEFSFVANDGFGLMTIETPGIHDAVVDGFTPEGPLVVTWGQTIQMTWEQWSDEIVGMWAIEASA